MSITWDTSSFQHTMRQYITLSKREEADAINKVSKDIALIAAKLNPKASLASIAALPSHVWWPKYIAKKLASGNYTYTQRFKDRKTKTMKSKRIEVKQGKWSVATARKVSKLIVAKRKWSSGFLRSAWIRVASSYGSALSESKFRKAQGTGTRATPTQLVAHLKATYTTKPSSETTGRIKEEAILQQAMRMKEQDMKVYIERKLQAVARRV